MDLRKSLTVLRFNNSVFQAVLVAIVISRFYGIDSVDFQIISLTKTIFKIF
jgi:hypothetical protein